MKTALVLGATGSMGFSLVKELVGQGIEVRAFARNELKLKQCINDFQAIPYIGDAFKLDHLVKAMEGVDVVFHAINIPYQD